MIETELKKKLNRYEIKVIKANDLRHSDALKVEISINEDLRQLLKNEVCSSERKGIVEYVLNNQDEHNRKRFYMKDYILNSLYGTSKVLFTDVELLETKKAIIQFYNVSVYDQFINDLKSNFKAILEIIKDTKQINLTMVIEA